MVDSGMSVRRRTALKIVLGAQACMMLGAVSAAVAQGEPPEASGVPKRFFLSGHSLTDDPFAEYIAAIGQSRGADMGWNEQIIIGSPISYRTRGDGNRPDPWNGYRTGKNRNGATGLDILKVLSQRSGQLYDTLIVAEGHKSVAQLMWNDTPRYLRHFHERLIEHNPSARTFLFESWEGIRDKSKPEPWIALEHDGSKLWSCVAERINVSLKHESRADRIQTIPAGAGLAELIDAIGKGDLPALQPAAGKSAIDVLLSDDVHLAPLGRYYVALLTYVTITGQPVEGVWRPQFVPEPTALALQKFAWDFHQNRKKQFTPLDLAGCRQFLVSSFCDAWNAYVPNAWQSPQPGCKTYFAQETMESSGARAPNPLAFDPAEDGRYWFPAP